MNPDQPQQTKAEPETHALRETAKDLAGESKDASKDASEDASKDASKEAIEAARSTLIKEPTTGAAIAGAVGLAAAVTFGAVETALGGAVAYAAYRLFHKRKEHKDSAAH